MYAITGIHTLLECEAMWHRAQDVPEPLPEVRGAGVEVEDRLFQLWVTASLPGNGRSGGEEKS